MLLHMEFGVKRNNCGPRYKKQTEHGGEISSVTMTAVVSRILDRLLIYFSPSHWCNSCKTIVRKLTVAREWYNK
jgi:hypothetical protein